MNKTLLTVGYVLAFVTGILYIIVIIGIPFGILNIVAARKIKAYRDNTGTVTKGNLTGWCIYLIFTNWIAALFTFLGMESNSLGINKNSLEDKLNELNKLYDKGIITKEEYDIRRTNIISGQ